MESTRGAAAFLRMQPGRTARITVSGRLATAYGGSGGSGSAASREGTLGAGEAGLHVLLGLALGLGLGVQWGHCLAPVQPWFAC